MDGFSNWDPRGQQIELAGAFDPHNRRHRRVVLMAVLIVLVVVAFGVLAAVLG